LVSQFRNLNQFDRRNASGKNAKGSLLGVRKRVGKAELFNTINVTQRKLPKALIETNKGDITEAGSPGYAQQIRRVTFSLCRDPDSVWGPIKGVEQVNMTGVRDPNRPVTYEGLRRSMANMFPPTLLSRLAAMDAELPLKYAKRYWKEVKEACLEAWIGEPSSRDTEDPLTGETHTVKIQYRIKDLVGVSSLAKLGKDIITSDLESKEPKRLEELTSKLMEVNWQKDDQNPWMRSQAGFAGQKDLYEVLQSGCTTTWSPRPSSLLVPAFPRWRKCSRQSEE
jgi:hypothetical protein